MMNYFYVQYSYGGNTIPSTEGVYANSEEEARKVFMTDHKLDAFWIDIISIFPARKSE